MNFHLAFRIRRNCYPVLGHTAHLQFTHEGVDIFKYIQYNSPSIALAEQLVYQAVCEAYHDFALPRPTLREVFHENQIVSALISCIIAKEPEYDDILE